MKITRFESNGKGPPTAPPTAPGAESVYGIEWGPWLGDDQLAASVWNLHSDLTVVQSSFDATTGLAWAKISGWVKGRKYLLENVIETTGTVSLPSVKEPRSMFVRVLNHK